MPKIVKELQRGRACVLTSVLSMLLLLLMLGGCGQEHNAPAGLASGYSVTDEQGTSMYFAAPPQRIMTLAMSSDAIVMGLGELKKLIAVNELADDPVSSNIVRQARQIERKVKNPSQEEVLAMQPDLVITYAWSNPEVVENIRTFGINVLVLKTPVTIDDIKKNVRTIAAALGLPQQGEALVGAMEERLRQVRAKTQRRQTRREVVLLSLMNTYGGAGCIYDEMCREAGVINGIAAAGLRSGQALTKEMLILIDPDVLIMPVWNDHGTFDIEKYNREFLEDPALQTMKAIRNRQLFYPREGFIYNCSQDVVFGVQEIARAAYGEEFDLPADSHLCVAAE